MIEDVTILPFLLFGLGIAIGAGFFMRRVMKLERQNAELTAQIRAEKEALERTGAALDLRFKNTAQEALSQSSEQFLKLAAERLKGQQADGAHDLDKRQKAIDHLLKPVQDNLKSLSEAIEQVKGTDKALREDVQQLNRETARLVGALRDPSAQGQWGEFILEGLLEKSGLIKGVHYETQKTIDTAEGKQRPDVVISMQDGFNIIVDAKAPLNEFSQRLGTDLNEEAFTELTQNLARMVREHVKKLGSKNYWENLESPDFVVMFLPSEHLYSMALRADPGLVDFASERAVIIASPTLLMSLLRVVAVSWRQVELAKNAQDISERGLELYKRLLTFTGHIEKVGKGISGAMRSYNDAVGSLERSVLPAARKFKDLQAGTALKDMDEPQLIETEARALNVSSEDQDYKEAS